jgi:hypothetical protein
MNRLLSIMAVLVYLSVGIVPNPSHAQSKTAARTITVYKTPT